VFSFAASVVCFHALLLLVSRLSGFHERGNLAERGNVMAESSPVSTKISRSGRHVHAIGGPLEAVLGRRHRCRSTLPTSFHSVSRLRSLSEGACQPVVSVKNQFRDNAPGPFMDIQNEVYPAD